MSRIFFLIMVKADILLDVNINGTCASAVIICTCPSLREDFTAFD